MCNFGITLKKSLFNLRDMNHLKDLGADGKILAILKLIFEK